MKELKIIANILIVLGILLLLVGYTFKMMELNDLYKGLYSGPIVFSIGLILLVVRKIKT